MALINCRNCGKPVSDRAERCPHCDGAITQETISKSKLPAVILIIVLLCCGYYPCRVTGKAYAQQQTQTTQTTTQQEQVSSPTDTINGHEYVDLGLSVWWATCNVGASSPEEYGDYYAWGETKTKAKYTDKNSSTRNKNMGSIAGAPHYDVARANWGGTWRLPTTSEIDELIYKCQDTLTTINGVTGLKVTGPSGNSIFLPAAGYRGGTSLSYAGDYGYYWSATPSSKQWAYELYFRSGDLGRDHPLRSFGRSVRAVSEPTTQTTQTTTQQAQVSSLAEKINGHEYVDLGLSVMWAACNVGASSPEKYGNFFAWGETSTKSYYSSNTSETTGKDMRSIAGNIIYDAACSNWGEPWRLPTASEIDELVKKCKWTWTTMSGHTGYEVTGPNGNSIFLPAAGCRDVTSHPFAGDYGYYWSATPSESDTQDACELFIRFGVFKRRNTNRRYGLSVRSVTETTEQPTPDYNGHDYVDLGLSVKWATCNVGASKPEGYGYYYAWGETRPKSSYRQDNQTYVKDNGITGDPSYDAARANWGGTWRLPTKQEISELKKKCKWTWTSINGYNGYKVTGPNGNSIFLPAAGYRGGSFVCCAGAYGGYWSDPSGKNNKGDAYTIFFSFGNSGRNNPSLSFNGHSVRPVTN